MKTFVMTKPNEFYVRFEFESQWWFAYVPFQVVSISIYEPVGSDYYVNYFVKLNLN